jgi:transcriptional regulator with XRE-family HTH domain
MLLKERREELGLDLKEIASRVEVEESVYESWENGRKIEGEPYIKLSQVLNIPISILLGLGHHESLKKIQIDIQDLEKYTIKILN